MEPRKIDPWEARERERAKRDAWRQGKKRPASGTPSSGGGSGDIVETLLAGEGGFDFQNNALPLGLLAAVLLLLLSSLPFDGLPAALAYRSFFTKAGSILLLFLAIVGGGNVGRNALSDVRRGPHPLLILLLVWTTVCFFLAPFRGYAALEFVRIVDGVAAYFLAGYVLKNGGKQAANLTVGLIGVGCLLSLLQIAEIGQQGGFRSDITMSRLGAHGNIGSVLLLLWPPALAFAVWPGTEDKRRVAALAASLIIGCALLAERARSSWIGAAASVLVLAACYFLAQKGTEAAASNAPRRRGHQTSLFARAAGSPFTLLIVGLVVLLAFGGGAVRFVAGRAATLGSGAATGGATFQSRLVSWGGAALMAREKPLTGWGLGTFPVLQGRWTHVGVEVETALRDGADNLSLAHSYYLQWAADSGYTGLFLYMAFLAAFVGTLAVKLPHLRSPFQKALVSGVLAVVVGSHVDALASPAHHFHGVWVLLWVWMGLGLAALRPPPARAGHTAEVQIAPLALSDGEPTQGGRLVPTLVTWGGGAVLGGIAVFCAAAFAAHLEAEGRRAPRGVLEVVANGRGAGQAGATLSWTARFHNNKGVSLPTSPGTTWSLRGSSPRLTQAAQLSLFVPPSTDASDLPGEKRWSEFRALLPVDAVRAAQNENAQSPPQVSVKAVYFDAYGRRYEAWSTRSLAVKSGN